MTNHSDEDAIGPQPHTSFIEVSYQAPLGGGQGTVAGAGENAQTDLNEISTADAGAYATACPIIRHLQMGLVSGTRIGPYEVASILGPGGMGGVYKARDTRLDRTVAIKVLPSDIAGDPATVVVRAAKRAARTGDQYVIAPSGSGS